MQVDQNRSEGKLMSITDRSIDRARGDNIQPFEPEPRKPKSSLLSKLPIALFVVAALIALPAGFERLTGGSDDVASRESLALTPGPATNGTLSASERVDFWRGRVGSELDYLNRNQLALELLAEARETGDLGSYAEAETVIAESLATNPTGVAGRSIAASVKYGIHDFSEALEQAEGVLVEDPDNFQAISIAGDAALEVGDYERAERYYQQLYGMVPGPAAAVRLGRLEWQKGNSDAAISRGREALASANASSLAPPELAFYALQLATFLLDAGDIDTAESLAAASVEIAPELPAAQAILGRALAAQGDIDSAIELFTEASAIIPRPEYLGALGDLYAVSGDEQEAEQQYLAVDLIAQIADIEQVVYNRELARFFADHGRETERAVTMARAELEVREDVLGYDTLAWALYQNGDSDEAESVARTLIELNSVDPEVLYHVGAILGAAGDTAEGITYLERALEISPSFDPIQAPVAEKILDDLRDQS